MSEFQDPDFTAVRNVGQARQVGTSTGGVEGGLQSGANGIAAEGDSDGLTRAVDSLHQGGQEVGRTTAVAYAVGAAGNEAAQLAAHWEGSAPKDADIDAADAAKAQALRAMQAAEELGTPAQKASTAAAAKAALQYANTLRAQRAEADEAFVTGMATLTTKVEQQRQANSHSKIDGTRPRLPGISNSIGSLKPPAFSAPSTPAPGTPAAPRTPAGAAPSTPAGTAPRTDLSKSEMPTMPQVPQGQQQPQAQPQQQQGQHPQAAAGGAPTGTPTPKAADKRRDSGDSTPTGLAGAIGAAGAGASPVGVLSPRATNPGYSVKDLVTGTNVTGRPSPQVNLSGGMPSTAPAQAAGTAAAPGGMGAPMAPMGGGMGGAGKGAGREAPRIVQAAEPYDDGIVPGGTILRGDEPPESKAS